MKQYIGCISIAFYVLVALSFILYGVATWMVASYAERDHVAKAQEYGTCIVNLNCHTCTYRIKTKQDGSQVCMFIKCRGCKEKPISLTFTPYPTEIPFDTDIPTLEYTPTSTLEVYLYPSSIPPYP